MTDATALWKPLRDTEIFRLERDGTLISRIDPGHQFLVSGRIEAAAALAGVDPQGAGALGLVTGAGFSIRLARDRMLIVSANGGLFAPGWHEEGYAVSAISTGLAVFEIEGERALEIVKRATTLSLENAGPSASVMFAGEQAILYRFERPDRLRLHVDRALAAYFEEWLQAIPF